MFVCCECCVLSGRGLCDELISRPEESYRLWCVVVYDLETSRMRRPWPALGRSATAKKIHVWNCCLLFSWHLVPWWKMYWTVMRPQKKKFWTHPLLHQVIIFPLQWYCDISLDLCNHLFYRNVDSDTVC
jgi:hypothetical protein